MCSFIDALVTDRPYPVKMMIVSYGNPMMTWPDTSLVKKGLERLDFLAVMDFHMTPTAELADIVLPAATFLERTGLQFTNQFFGWDRPSGHIALASKVVEVDECLPDWKFWFELAKRLGYEKWFPWSTIEEAIDYQLKPSGLTVEKLRNKASFYGDVPTPRKHVTEGFKTPTGKVEIYSNLLKNMGYDPLPVFVEPCDNPRSGPGSNEYPLVLVTGSRLATYPHSGLRTLPSLRKITPRPEAQMHPETARECHIQHDDDVLVETPRGSIAMKANVTDKIIPGIVSISHGWTEANANLLVNNNDRDPIFGSPNVKSLICRIHRQ